MEKRKTIAKLSDLSPEQQLFLKEHSLFGKDNYDTFQKVEQYLQIHGFDIDYNPTEIGLMCESILDDISDIS